MLQRNTRGQTDRPDFPFSVLPVTLDHGAVIVGIVTLYRDGTVAGNFSDVALLVRYVRQFLENENNEMSVRMNLEMCIRRCLLTILLFQFNLES